MNMVATPVRDLLASVRSMRRAYSVRRKARNLENRFGEIGKSKKIVYALLPDPRMSNLGDHAQVIAIRKWLSRHLPHLPVVEVSKIETLYCHSVLRKLIAEGDIIILHSGGNLGDRGMLSEKARRLLISSFPENRIISLPQTIYFSDSENGRRERNLSSDIYSRHEHLTVMGRDPESGVLARKLFPTAEVLIVPDFVLSLSLSDFGLQDYSPLGSGVLACLRRDTESVLSSEDRRGIVNSFRMGADLVDTSVRRPIYPHQRTVRVGRFLKKVLEHEMVITDRFHGLIFSVICRRPTVVLPTVDHKLTSAMEWFRSIEHVAFSPSLTEIGETAQALRLIASRETPDFVQEYFDPLARKLFDQRT